MKHDPDHYLTQPMDNQEAAHNRRIAVTDENVAACAQAIRDLDRITPRPLTAEDQARAVLSFLANGRLTHDPLPRRHLSPPNG